MPVHAVNARPCLQVLLYCAFRLPNISLPLRSKIGVLLLLIRNLPRKDFAKTAPVNCSKVFGISRFTRQVQLFIVRSKVVSNTPNIQL
jgi:hypothetical protein